MKWSCLPVAMAAILMASPASAQLVGALERFEPVPAGDAMFGVPSPAVGGHLVARASAAFDLAYRPLSIETGGVVAPVVREQGFLHVGGSLALWDRLLISLDLPFALVQGGESPRTGATTFKSPSGADVGDLRLGARVRLYGDYWDPFQLGVGGYVYFPTAPKLTFAGDGSVRGEPQLLLGGRTTHFVWNAALGTTLHASAHPSTFDAGLGAAVVLRHELVQLGPELTLSAPFKHDTSLSQDGVRVVMESQVSAELMLGVKVRPIRPLVIGFGAGPGLTTGWGTPKAFAVGSIGYEPLPPRHTDRDGDGILDDDDACPDVRGVRSENPRKNGCPADRDGDGIADVDDACPDVKGVRSDDPRKNGCPPPPPDRDGDGILDADDACPDVKGVRSDDPRKNGCPPPPDRDGDGIPDAVDACPDVKGGADPDPKQNGCPHVQVTKTQITISRQVTFRFGQSALSQTVDPVSDGLLTEVRDAIVEHPELLLIEVQGHTDNVGPDGVNLRLSQARANAVRTWLVDRGIPPKKLTAQGYGSKVPLVPNTTDEHRQENRRVQFVIRTKAKDH